MQNEENCKKKILKVVNEMLKRANNGELVSAKKEFKEYEYYLSIGAYEAMRVLKLVIKKMNLCETKRRQKSRKRL